MFGMLMVDTVRHAAIAYSQFLGLSEEEALAGDEPSDFDDLYNYIIDSDDARALDPMLRNGWFLIDNPVGQ